MEINQAINHKNIINLHERAHALHVFQVGKWGKYSIFWKKPAVMRWRECPSFGFYYRRRKTEVFGQHLHTNIHTYVITPISYMCMHSVRHMSLYLCYSRLSFTVKI